VGVLVVSLEVEPGEEVVLVVGLEVEPGEEVGLEVELGQVVELEVVPVGVVVEVLEEAKVEGLEVV
jgi:ribosomal protein L2